MKDKTIVKKDKTIVKNEDVWIPTFCLQCDMGPELIKVHRVNGTAIKVEGNNNLKDIIPYGPLSCVKSHGLIQKVYNPERIKAPMKRTNPQKGKGIDPGWVEISWDEALNIVAEKLKAIRKKGLIDENGYPRLAMTFGGGGSAASWMGTAYYAFMNAWGPIERGLGASTGVKCGHTEHAYAEFWHRGFLANADTPLTKLVIGMGNNSNVTQGPSAIRRQADARAKGLKRIQAEPSLAVTAATSQEWIPIKPKTDAAFLLAMVNIMLFEIGKLDIPFLKKMTNSPYLVGPDGLFLRDPETRKPLLWDPVDKRAKPFDSKDFKDIALEGTYTINGVQGKTAFDLLKEHVKQYTAEWAAKICDIPLETLRRVTREYVDTALSGSTMEVDGEQLPYRPAVIVLGRGANAGVGSVQCVWAQHVAAILVGALEVPGALLGSSLVFSGPLEPATDGFPWYPFQPTDAKNWLWPPPHRDGALTLTPLLSGRQGLELSPSHLGWLNITDPPEGWPKATIPDVLVTYKCNPLISMWGIEKVERVIKQVPYYIALAYTKSETTEYADLLLPENTDLESLQLVSAGGIRSSEHYWMHSGWALRQPVVKPVYNTMDLSDIFTEIVARVGLLKEYNEAINNGALGARLFNKYVDYKLELDKKYTVSEIMDRLAKAATRSMTKGKEEHDLEYFKKHGAFFTPRTFPLKSKVWTTPMRRPWYLHPEMAEKGMRWELPYEERLMKIGEELKERLHEKGVHFWDHQLRDYEALPSWEDYPGIFENQAKNYGKDPKEYDLWFINTKSIMYAWSHNVTIPLMAEAADQVLGHKGVMMHPSTAEKRGIKHGDKVWIESPLGRVEGTAFLREGIRPDCILVEGQFGQWVTPLAKDFGIPCSNPLMPLNYETTDAGGSAQDLVKVKVYKKG